MAYLFPSLVFDTPCSSDRRQEMFGEERLSRDLSFPLKILDGILGLRAVAPESTEKTHDTLSTFIESKDGFSQLQPCLWDSFTGHEELVALWREFDLPRVAEIRHNDTFTC